MNHDSFISACNLTAFIDSYQSPRCTQNFLQIKHDFENSFGFGKCVLVNFGFEAAKSPKKHQAVMTSGLGDRHRVNSQHEFQQTKVLRMCSCLHEKKS